MLFVFRPSDVGDLTPARGEARHHMQESFGRTGARKAHPPVLFEPGMKIPKMVFGFALQIWDEFMP